MKNMTLINIANACNGIYHGTEDEKNMEVTAITTDSRKVSEGCLFVAIKGNKFDGHDFIESSYVYGALAVLVEKELKDCTYPYIRVESTLEAVKKIAAFYRSQLSLTVVGITGSVGKTSTKEAIAGVLSQKYRVLKTEGNFNNELGVPLTLFRLSTEDEVAVVEMGISDFGEMHRLSEIVKPDICVITNIGICHLENLKSRDGVLRAKSEIFDYMNPNGAVVLNGDDDKLSTIGMIHGALPRFFGMNPQHDVWAENVRSEGLYGTYCRVHDARGEYEVTIPIPGKHMVHNVLAATMVAELLGLTNEEIKRGVEKLTTMNGRNNLIFGNKYTIIDDCYNANPMSMRASVDVLCEAQTRKVAILGDMGELGADEKKLHYELGEYVAKSDVDLLLCVGDLSVEMQQGYRMARPTGEIMHYDTVGELLQDLCHQLHAGDAVLVKASHFMKFSEIVEFLKEQ
ncbi:MAG: UDP-N-acetylmuramoyl-tripeptide--D-alanyl-D-alanine ligase [Lachnospiraceae bacterium]